MKKISRTDFDPFNHGVVNPSYRDVDDQQYRELSAVLNKGWKFKNIKKIEQACEGAEKSSNNYRIIFESTPFLLKHSHINDPITQDLVNKCLIYCGNKGIPVAHLIPTVNKDNHFVDKSGIYCLYDFIDGEHFDGSRIEMEEAAATLAKIHIAFKNIPYKKEILSIKGKLVKHDRKELKKIIKIIKSSSGKTDFDKDVVNALDEINEISNKIFLSQIALLPFQIIHYDVHPHNMMFDKKDKKLLAYLDFDPIIYSQKIRDVGFAMHRLARTYGKHTERQIDIGVDIRDRAKLFLEAYQRVNKLTDVEIKNIPLIIQDEALKRIINILASRYLKKDPTWSFDLAKQITILREGSLFDF